MLSNYNGNVVLRRPLKAALVAAVSLPLLLPAGPAAAADSVVSGSASASAVVTAGASSAPQATSNASAALSADAASKIKITEEQAVAKVRKLFPLLEEADVSGVQLGNTHSYPVNENELVWTINWSVQRGNGSHGFSSQVNAVNGDIVSAYISSEILEPASSYYPPKISREEGEKIARAFILEAAPSVKSGDIKITDEQIVSADSALFGPIQYYYIFTLLKNGLPSNRDQISVSVSGNGEILSFTKPYNDLVYPSATPSISKEAAVQILTKGFDLELSYTPIYRHNKLEQWILAWKPAEGSMNDISAVNGKRLSNEGKELESAIPAYEAVPKSKAPFQKAGGSKELTAEQAAAAVKKVAAIPADRKLTSQMLNNDSQSPGDKSWYLVWENPTNRAGGYFPSRSTARVNATTGEVTQYNQEEFSAEKSEVQPAAAGAKKLSPAAAKQRALTLIDALYDNASGNLKLVWNGEENSVVPEGRGYSYQFIPYHQGVPVNGINISLNLDIYGNLSTYYATGNGAMEKIPDNLKPTIAKAAAAKSYLDQYTVELKYGTYGGYYTSSTYIKPETKLVYAAKTKDEAPVHLTLDAVTGKWIQTYEMNPGTVKAADVADLKGHPAQEQLTELVKFGVLVPDESGKIYPDQEITVVEWLAMAVKSAVPYYASYSSSNEKAIAGVNPEDEDYNTVRYAAELGWIDSDATLQLKQKLSRDELAAYLAATLKYDKLAGFLQNDPAVAAFSDNASIKNKGAVALSLKLGLLQGEAGAFQPQKTVTRADAAVVLMKLVQLQGQLDQNLAYQ